MGFLTYAVLLYLFLDTGSGRRQNTHRWLGYALLTFLIGHILLLLITEPVTRHYIAWSAPDYMLAGIAATVLLLVAVVLAHAASRRFWHSNHRHFQRWHYALSISALAASLWHMLGSGFYITGFEGWVMVSVGLLVVISHSSSKTPNIKLSLTQLTGVPLLCGVFLWLKHAS